MTLDTLIMLMGTLTALLPFLGFPIRWDNIIMVVLGILVITLGIIVRRRGLGVRSRGAGTSYVESVPQAPDMHEAA